MPTISAPDPLVPPPVYTKKAGDEPLRGYTLLEPLGRGGFGEVWKCEAPGGLHKAVKFVAGCGGDGQLLQEYEAFQRIKAIRHPYLLCLERVELVDNELVMVMGLADRQLGDRFHECRQAGLPGIPRDELIGYLKEAAEALDVIGAEHGLQHLDVKPANLFLTYGHVQVGDYGLVSKLDSATGTGLARGLTPKYAAPEVLRGQVHTRSDQYSLALVYQELLTGSFPFSGKSSQLIMLQHVTNAPDLSGLSERDRGPVGTALAKQPDDRFPSCRAFIDALAHVKAAHPRLSLITPGQKTLPGREEVLRDLEATPPPSAHSRLPENAVTRGSSEAGEPTQRQPRSGAVSANPQVPRLVPIGGRAPASAAPVNVAPPPSPQTSPQPQPDDSLFAGVRLGKVLSVLPVGWLRGREASDPELPPADMIRAVVAAAGKPETALQNPFETTQLPDGKWACRFLSTIDPRVAKVKLNLLLERGLTMDAKHRRRVVFRQIAPALVPVGRTPLFGKKQPSSPPSPAGIEVVVELPEPGATVGEVSVQGHLFGSPPADFAKESDHTIGDVMEEVRRLLNNFQDRRKHPRLPAEFPVILYPVHPDLRVDNPLNGRCCNVSQGGLALQTTAQPTTKYAYVTFEGVPGTSGLALLIQIVRTDRQEGDIHVAGRYRLDFWPAQTG